MKFSKKKLLAKYQEKKKSLRLRERNNFLQKLGAHQIRMVQLS